MAPARELEEHPTAPRPRPGRERAWRRRIRANAGAERAYRLGVGLLGLVVVVLGLTLVPLPGPGWLIVFLGVALWATEFRWAHRLNLWGRARLRVWEAYVRRASWPVRLSLLAGTGLAVGVFFWAFFFVVGLPGWLPDEVAAVLHSRLGL